MSEEKMEERSPAEVIAADLTKEQLLSRCSAYVRAEAKRKKVEPWVIVGHIFANGSGVSSALWHDYIDRSDPKEHP
jgi:hypothetical protein